MKNNEKYENISKNYSAQMKVLNFMKKRLIGCGAENVLVCIEDKANSHQLKLLGATNRTLQDHKYWAGRKSLKKKN